MQVRELANIGEVQEVGTIAEASQPLQAGHTWCLCIRRAAAGAVTARGKPMTVADTIVLAVPFREAEVARLARRYCGDREQLDT